MRIVFLTAGAAGMFCGSCMHDNALSRAMRAAGDDVVLLPVYTPIRTDEIDITLDRVFFGGIHVYLLQRMPWLRFVPRGLRGWLDRPGLIRWATRKAFSTDPIALGDLTVSMLSGSLGRQAGEVERLVDWIADEMRPEAVIFSNLLIGGAIPSLRKRMPDVKIIVTLQGDDIFLEHLPQPARSEAIALCGKLAAQVDRFVSHSEFYRDKMCGLLGIRPAAFDVHPLTIDLAPYDMPSNDLPSNKSTNSESPATDPPPPRTPYRIGYFARIAPEKGLHVLVDAFEHLATQPGHSDIELHVAGWLGENHQPYLVAIQDRLARAHLSARFVYHGSPDLSEKIALLRTFDVLSVPAPYEDPKGLYLLEAMAAGVPVIQPDHGAFGELIRSTGGGMLFPPNDWRQLAACIESLRANPNYAAELVDAARNALPVRHAISVGAHWMRQTCLACRVE